MTASDIAAEIAESETEVDELATAWAMRLEAALRIGDQTVIGALFSEHATWRDLLTHQWDFTNATGADQIADGLLQGPGFWNLRSSASMRTRLDRSANRIQAFFDADTSLGRASLVAELALGDDGAPYAEALLTQLVSLSAWPWRTGDSRPAGRDNHEVVDRVYWHDQRAVDREFTESDPTVVVVGAGHCGLSAAARLHALGIPTLVIEKLPRVGDNWRNRYPSLTLHDPVAVDHLPYLPFPTTWPRYTPRDKFADFLEYYATALDLDVWTGSTIERTEHRADVHRWELEVRRPDGSHRLVRPAHLVLATGWMGDPLIPDLAGRTEFRGTVLHSGEFGGGEAWRGRKAVVVGTGNSGHDIAQDLYEHGAASVTLIQRSPTYVVRAETFHKIWWGRWDSGDYTVEEADTLAALHNLQWSLDRQEPLVRHAAEMDAELLAGLNRAGFRTDLGYQNKGTAGSSTFKRTANFHQDMGAAQLIVDGKIRVHSGAGLVGLTETAALLSDGTRLDADLVVLATGYGGISDVAKKLLGDAAETCEGVYGLGEDGERRIVWRRSPVDGLWFMTGNIQPARFYSSLLALQIAATEAGLRPYSAAG